MVDKTSTESGSQTELAAGPTSLRREKPVIEGEVVASEVTVPTPRDEAAAADVRLEGQDAAALPPEDDTTLESFAHESAAHEPAAHELGAHELAADATTAQEEHVTAHAPVEPRGAGNDAAPPRRRTSIWPIAAAIVIGAGLAVGGAYYLHTLDATPDGVAVLAARQSELETRLAARLAALEKKPDTAAGLRDALAGQDKRIADAEAAAREAIASAKSALAAAEANKNANVASSPPSSAPPPAVDLSPLETRIGDLDRRLAELDQKMAKPAPPAVDLSPMETRIGDLDRRLADLDQKLAQLTPPAGAKSDLRIAPEAARPEAEAEAVAIIASSLVGKVERGLPYAPELAALANRGVDKSKFALLEANAATGVPTARVLAARFAAVSEKVAAPEPFQPEGSVFDRMVQSAGRLVRVRKIGDTSGDELPARVGRISAALQAGAVEEALAQWNELPERAKAKSQDFATLAKTRLDAVTAARALETEAIAALGKTKS